MDGKSQNFDVCITKYDSSSGCLMESNDHMINTLNWMIPSIWVKNLTIQQTLIGAFITYGGFYFSFQNAVHRYY